MIHIIHYLKNYLLSTSIYEYYSLIFNYPLISFPPNSVALRFSDWMSNFQFVAMMRRRKTRFVVAEGVRRCAQDTLMTKNWHWLQTVTSAASKAALVHQTGAQFVHCFLVFTCQAPYPLVCTLPLLPLLRCSTLFIDIARRVFHRTSIILFLSKINSIKHLIHVWNVIYESFNNNFPFCLTEHYWFSNIRILFCIHLTRYFIKHAIQHCIAPAISREYESKPGRWRKRGSSYAMRYHTYEVCLG